MGKFYKIYMVVVRLHFTQMVKITFSQQNKIDLRSFLTIIMFSLLGTHGVEKVLLSTVINNTFLPLTDEQRNRLLSIISNERFRWILLMILFEIKHLDVEFVDGDVLLSINEHFTFSGFNIDEMLSRLPRLLAEYEVLHQYAISRRMKRKRQEAYDAVVRKQSIEQFINALATLWKNKKSATSFNSFFQTLYMVAEEFDSGYTNVELLKTVVIEFMMTIYNSTTRSYIMKQEPCEDPLTVFKEYCIERGVFSPRVPLNEVIRVCFSTKEDCLFGDRCSGVHQDPVIHTLWNSNRVFGMCCPEYAKTGKCSNPACQFPHYSGHEYYRALKQGGKDSFRMRKAQIDKEQEQEQKTNGKRQRTD